MSSRVLQAGPAVGAVETTCEITDPVSDEVLARYRQTVSVERNSSRLQLRIEFDTVDFEPSGNPWMSYYACRFAWENESASITRGMLGQAAGFRMERFESPDYIEAADHDTRMVIVPHGRPYHRRTGRRMLDSLLAVEGEPQRVFEFTLDFDQAWPMRVASEVLQPVIIHSTKGLRPSSAESGWILGLSAKNVIVARTRTEPVGSSDPVEPKVRLVLVLEETEGRSAACRILTARRPKTARLRRPDGSLVEDLPREENGVPVNFSRFQIREVELTF